MSSILDPKEDQAEDHEAQRGCVEVLADPPSALADRDPASERIQQVGLTGPDSGCRLPVASNRRGET